MAALSAAGIRERYLRLREAAGPSVTVVAATKYVPLEELGVLLEAGVEVVGENRAQDLAAKHAFVLQLRGERYRVPGMRIHDFGRSFDLGCRCSNMSGKHAQFSGSGICVRRKRSGQIHRALVAALGRSSAAEAVLCIVKVQKLFRENVSGRNIAALYGFQRELLELGAASP